MPNYLISPCIILFFYIFNHLKISNNIDELYELIFNYAKIKSKLIYNSIFFYIFYILLKNL